ncbi:right-handed parallel beta-helix repeat-containing protein [Caldithrix abyssi]
MKKSNFIVLYLCFYFIFSVTNNRAGVIVVAESGGHYASVQAAIDHATAGDSILVREKSTPYFEKINFDHGGDATNGYITLMAYPGEHPILDGSGVPNNPASYTDDMIYLENVSYVRIIGFEIRNVNTTEGSGIRVYGYGSYIEIRDNEIHEIRGGAQDGGAMGITIYGADDNRSINHLIIDGNHIHDCDPAWSEALTLNGNVEQFEVTNNLIEDVNNIGIDFIGGEDWLSARFARNGRCAWNQVYRANSSYGGGWAAGIYVDGGQDIVIENNVVSECDLGIEIGAENSGVVTSGIIVRNNIIYKNNKAGLVFGGYDVNTGRVKNCVFTGNTCYQNDAQHQGLGELWIQYAEDNELYNNIFYANDQNVLLYSESGNVNNLLNYNLWYAESGENSASWTWNNHHYGSFSGYQAGSGQDAHSLFADPLFTDAAQADFHLSSASPAVDAGNPTFIPADDERDMDHENRLAGSRVDVGADELQPTSAAQEAEPTPRVFELLSIYPNPFNSETQIRFQIDKAGKVELAVYDPGGRKIRQLINRYQAAGTFALRWNGRDDQNRICPSGAYFVTLEINGQKRAQKALLIR